VELPPQK
jgi:diaminopropionate ammonia-lyase